MALILSLATFTLAPARADYSIRLAGGNVAVSIIGSLVQGVPNQTTNETFPFGSVPVFHHTLQGQNASYLTSVLNNAIRMKTPSAYANQVQFSATSDGRSMNYTMSFQVGNVARVRGGVQVVDLSWRSFVFADDFGASGVSINRIVPNYLQDSIIGLAQPGTSTPQVRIVNNWYLNEKPLALRNVPGEVKNLALFNFSSLSLPLSNWRVSQNLFSGVVLKSTAGFNLTFITRAIEPDVTTVTDTNVSHRLQVTIETPSSTLISGDEILFETGEGWEPQVMLVIIAATLLLLVITALGEKRLKPAFRQGRKSSWRR